MVSKQVSLTSRLEKQHTKPLRLRDHRLSLLVAPFFGPRASTSSPSPSADPPDNCGQPHTVDWQVNKESEATPESDSALVLTGDEQATIPEATDVGQMTLPCLPAVKKVVA
ncbi:hypothetical protein GB937_010228 [Aspergillus fischeri]|nr:hypothetical protein GB937_010228 [Aspergillus fischeri]